MRFKIPDRQQSLEIHYQFARDLIETWLKAFHLTPEMVNLSEEEVLEIDQQYFYSYWLRLQCK